MDTRNTFAALLANAIWHFDKFGTLDQLKALARQVRTFLGQIEREIEERESNES